MTQFDFQPVLEGSNIRIRPLTAADFDDLQSAASHPATWADHPAKDRWKPEVFTPYFAYLLANRAVAITKADTGKIIGGSRYYLPPDEPEAVAIGFTFLDHNYWGGGTNRIVKQLMLRHAFASFDEVWFHIAPTNLRSQIATQRFGAMLARRAMLDFSGLPSEWLCYRLNQQEWHQAEIARDMPHLQRHSD